MRFSRRTLTALTKSISETHTHTDIDMLAFELGWENAAVGSSKLARCFSMVKEMRRASEEAGNDGPIAELIEITLQSASEYQLKNLESLSGLLASLEVDGFEFNGAKLIPGTPTPASTSSEVSALEGALQDFGMNVAAEHYKQACDNLVDGNFESANSQIRSFLEDLFISICDKICGKSFGEASAALQHLRDKGVIEPSEWNTFRGFWDTCQTNGSHHGLTNSEEALYRLHMATAISRYLIHILREA